MNKTLTTTKLLQALEICKSLAALQGQPSELPYRAIALFCEIAREPSELLRLSQQYATETQEAFEAVYKYGTSADNWRINCSLGFGVKDHCSILSFFLNLYRQEFTFFTGNFNSPEAICELLKDWKGIDLTPLLEERFIEGRASRLSYGGV